MKWCVAVCAVTLIFCARESDSFKILKKLKDIIHPTVSTTTIIPILPEYENQHHAEDDSRSWEQESSTSSTKNKHTEDDSSTSQSSEKTGESIADSTKKYKNIKSETTGIDSLDSFKTNRSTTTTSNYNSAYGNNFEKQGSSNSNFEDQESRTTTDRYEQNNNENYPGQSSFTGSFNKQEVKSTTPTSYDFSNQNNPEQTYGGFNTGSNSNFETQESRTTTGRYEQNNNENYPGQSSFTGSFNNQEVKSTTPTSYDFSNQNNPEQTYGGFNTGKAQTTTVRNYDEPSNINIPDQSSSFGGVTGDELLSAGKDLNITSGSETTGNTQGQNHEDQSSIYGNYNNERSRTTTQRTNDNTYGLDKPNQSPSFDSFNEENTEMNAKNKTRNRPEQSSYDNFNNQGTTSTQSYDNTNYNQVQPVISSGDNGITGTFFSTSTTSTPTDGLPESSLQGGNQPKQTAGFQPTYSTSKGSNQTKHHESDGDNIIFPDDPSLNPTPETERTFGEDDPHLKDFHHKGLTKKKIVPVTGEEERRIIDAPSRECEPGQTFSKKKNMCVDIARK